MALILGGVMRTSIPFLVMVTFLLFGCGEESQTTEGIGAQAKVGDAKQNLILFCAKKRSLCGYFDVVAKKFAILPQFEAAYDFESNGLAMVKQNGKWGYIDTSGLVVIVPQFESSFGFADNGLAVVKQNGKWGYVDTKGLMVIEPQFEDASNFAANGVAKIQQNDKWGYVDAKGRLVILPQFEWADDFSAHGLARVKKNDKWGFIDDKGQFINGMQFDSAWDFANNGLAAVRLNGKWGYIDTNGLIVIPPQFEDAFDFSANGLARVKQNDKWGYTNSKGEVVIAPQFERADNFYVNDLARVGQNGKFGYIDAKGRMVVVPQFDDADDFALNGLARIRQNGRYGYINTKGRMVIAPHFSDAARFADNGLAWIEQDGDDKFVEGYIDSKGKLVVYREFLSNGAVTSDNDGFSIRNADNQLIWQTDADVLAQASSASDTVSASSANWPVPFLGSDSSKSSGDVDILSHSQPALDIADGNGVASRAIPYLQAMLLVAKNNEMEAIAPELNALGALVLPSRGDRKNARKMNVEGLESFKSGDFDSAIAKFKEAAQTDPADQEIANNLGYAFLSAGKMAEAQTALYAALALEPKRSSAWANLGMLLAKSDKIDDGVAAYRLAFQFSRNQQTTRDFLAKQAQEDSDPKVRQVAADVLKWVDARLVVAQRR